MISGRGVLIAAALLLPHAASAQQRPSLQLSVTPASVVVGMPFDMHLTVSAPAGAVVLFPPATDSGASVRLLDPVAISRGTESATADGNAAYIARYRLAAWDIGEQSITLQPVVVQMANDTVSLPVRGAGVTVLTVLPTDTLQRVPKGARGLFAIASPWWRVWLPLILLFIALVALFRWWYARRTPAPAPGLAESYLRELERIQSLPLVHAGERGRAITLTVDVLRQFLSMRIPRASLGKTTAELKQAVAAQPHEVATTISNLLDSADNVKFAREDVGLNDVERVMRDAAAVVRLLGDHLPTVDPAAAAAETAA